MRKVACFLLTGFAFLGSAMLASAAETWRWKDANGVVHYSDRPVPGAERVEVVAPKPSSSPPRQTGVDPAAAAPAPRAATPPAIVPYTRCLITAPASDETFNAVTSVTAGMVLEPNLQDGHRIEVLLDGAAVADWPPDALNHTLTDLLRGSHKISARVLDANGNPACDGPTVMFYIRLPTVQAPRPTPH